MDKLKGKEDAALPVPAEAGEVEETFGGGACESPVKVASDAVPFPDGDPPPDASAVERPSVRGGFGRYIFLFVCAALGAFAVFAVAAGVGDALGRTGITLPALLYGEVVNSGLSEIPKNGDGVILTGRVRVPAAPPVAEDGSGEKPGALEADGEEAPDGGTAPEDPADLPVRSVDLSAADALSVINDTDYSPDFGSIAKKERTIPTAAELYAEYGDGAPLVLIVHTHGTESYSPAGADTYSSSDTFRSLDPDEGVVSVGETVREILAERGIGVIHCTSMFDAADFSSAYAFSGEAAARIVAEHPSVRYVLDIHRDALITAEGENLRPVIKTDGGDAAQIMVVVGTDGAGADHPGWEDNLSLALKLQENVFAVCPGLMRSVDLRRESFNQQLAPGSLLIEAGAAANCLDEAKRAAGIFADVLADAILGE
ncbi:MAG: stage II sporulation protein P [Clostridia bacterium]|nr:stage II sporulation protein P [Clostridia bacterium]